MTTSTAHQARPFEIFNISAEITDTKVGEAYVIFSVRGSLEKQKSPTVAGSKGAFSWAESTFELQIPDPTNASLEVKAFQRRALIPDRLLGEFALTLAHPGATANLGGDLAKKGGVNGRVNFKIRPKGAGARHGGVITNRDSAYPSSQTLNKLPTMERDKAQNTIDQGKGSAGVITDAASAKADATTAEPSPTAANMPTGATGETNVTVNATERKLQEFKADLAAGRPRPHQPEHPGYEQQTSGDSVGGNSGQGAFSKAIGLPPQAGTASDEPGTGAAHNVPYDAGLGGASGAVAGPVAPTGQGGVLGGTGGNLTGPVKQGTIGSQVKGAAMNAADKAQGAMRSAKQTLRQ